MPHYLITCIDRKDGQGFIYSEGENLTDDLATIAEIYAYAEETNRDMKVCVDLIDRDKGTCVDATNDVIEFIFNEERDAAADAALDYAHERTERAMMHV